MVLFFHPKNPLVVSVNRLGKKHFDSSSECVKANQALVGQAVDVSGLPQTLTTICVAILSGFTFADDFYVFSSEFYL